MVGYDTDAVRVKRLEAGESYIEDVSSCELAAALNSGRFRLSSDADVCTGFEVAVIAVPTPLTLTAVHPLSPMQGHADMDA